jgi:butyryl-CoA dehydrogenase
VTAGHADLAHAHPDAAARQRAREAYDYLVPVFKGWSTEMAIDVASAGVQVHGGMGFIEEAGAAQLYRDARILPIYGGTTAIQANDLVGRKTARDKGKVARVFAAEMRATAQQLAGSGDVDLEAIARQLDRAVAAYEQVVAFVVDRFADDVLAVYAGSVPYLKLAGIVHGGWQLARAAQAAAAALQQGADDGPFLRAKIATARYFADHVLSQASGLCSSVVEGSAGVLALAPEQF